MKRSAYIADTPAAEVLPDALVGALAGALKPARLSAKRKDAIRSNLLARVAAEKRAASMSQAFTFVHVHEGEWNQIAPKVFMKPLFERADEIAFLVRFEPGGVAPEHGHDGVEECIVLDGEIMLQGVACRAGDYHRADKGTRHMPVSSPRGGLMYVRASAPLAL